jgi:chorismate mutase/prephenate dehydratase
MEEVAEGKADYGVLPIENSSAGAVSDVYDLLMSYNNVIVAETYLRVAHVLAALPGAKLEEIRTVYSHAQGLMQCSDFLEAYDMNRVALSNTAIAAKTVAESGDLTVAAICSEKAAKLQGLTVLKKPVNNNRTNTTRFIIISGKPIFAMDAERVSICFEAHHEPGALYRLLSHIIYNSLNMTGIESRPIPEKNWEYRFFVDFEGNLDDPGVLSALHGIEAESSVMKILGNY